MTTMITMIPHLRDEADNPARAGTTSTIPKSSNLQILKSLNPYPLTLNFVVVHLQWAVVEEVVEG
jgi:hypothetical protein